MTGKAIAALSAATCAAAVGFYLTVTGRLTADTGWGRSLRPLGPNKVQITAPIDTVFDVIAAPYLARTPRAMAGKLRVIECTEKMALAEHYTPVLHGRITAKTLEIVSFSRPNLISFRLIRGPVPYVNEEFRLSGKNHTTMLEYSGELGMDFWSVGRWWADRVASVWEAAVSSSLGAIQHEAERRAKAGH